MRGTYPYAPLKLALAKVVKKAERPGNSLVFIDGEYIEYQHSHIELPRIAAGDYLLMMKAEWAPMNTERKLILNIYAPDPLQLNRILSSKISQEIVDRMEQWLDYRLNLGAKYKPPGLALQ